MWYPGEEINKSEGQQLGSAEGLGTCLDADVFLLIKFSLFGLISF